MEGEAASSILYNLTLFIIFVLNNVVAAYFTNLFIKEISLSNHLLRTILTIIVIVLTISSSSLYTILHIH